MPIVPVAIADRAPIRRQATGEQVASSTPPVGANANPLSRVPGAGKYGLKTATSW